MAKNLPVELQHYPQRSICCEEIIHYVNNKGTWHCFEIKLMTEFNKQIYFRLYEERSTFSDIPDIDLDFLYDSQMTEIHIEDYDTEKIGCLKCIACHKTLLTRAQLSDLKYLFRKEMSGNRLEIIPNYFNGIGFEIYSEPGFFFKNNKKSK